MRRTWAGSLRRRCPDSHKEQAELSAHYAGGILGHFRSSWREKEALGLLNRSDGVPAGVSQKETPRAQGNGFVPTHADQEDL
jgi:hypothetical protein